MSLAPARCSPASRQAAASSQPPHCNRAPVRQQTRQPRRACQPKAMSDASSGGGGGASSSPAPPLREVLSMTGRQKLDARDDRDFYSLPRIVHHLDANFRAQLTQLFRQLIPEGAAVLDLCSSWVSHLPLERRYGRVVGHGMNAAELARNQQLTEFFVRDLNRQPGSWALADGSLDAVVCTASVQYLQQPEVVFAEIRRVLKPGGVAIIAFSNRMFYEKAIAAWRDNSDWGRCQLVKSYFAAAGGFSDPEVIKQVQLPPEGPPGQSPLQQLQQWAERLWQGGGGSDPFFAVVARREA